MNSKTLSETRPDLESMSGADLKTIAKGLSIAQSGSKAKLIARIDDAIAAKNALADEEEAAAEPTQEAPKAKRGADRSQRLEEMAGYAAELETLIGECGPEDGERFHKIEKLANRIFDRAYRSRKELTA